MLIEDKNRFQQNHESFSAKLCLQSTENHLAELKELLRIEKGEK